MTLPTLRLGMYTDVAFHTLIHDEVHARDPRWGEGSGRLPGGRNV